MIDAAAFLPHEPPMRMIDCVESLSDVCGRGMAMVTEDNPFVDGHGRLEPVAFIEFVAQTFAAWKGCGRAEGADVPHGMLVAVGPAEVVGEASVGDSITIDVEQTAELTPFFLIDGILSKDGQVIARASLRIVGQ